MHGATIKIKIKIPIDLLYYENLTNTSSKTYNFNLFNVAPPLSTILHTVMMSY